MLRFFKRRENNFLSLISQQAGLTLNGFEALKDYMETRNPEKAAELKATEKKADEIRRILIDELNRTFVTPIDREDIFGLSRTIDDMVDYAYSTISEMEILKVNPTTQMQRMVSLLRDAASEIFLATERLKDHPGVAMEHSQRAKALENRVEDVYREALAELFGGPEDASHIIKMLKKREVYRHLSNAADRTDEAANHISDIVVKMT
jgi:uncharacterized protein